jgi:hypothetical protein
MSVSIPPVLVPTLIPVLGKGSIGLVLKPTPEAFATIKMLARKLFLRKPVWGIFGTPLLLTTPLDQMAMTVVHAYANANLDEDAFSVVCSNFDKLYIPPRRGPIEETIAMGAAVLIHEYNQHIGGVRRETTSSVY